MLRVYDEDENEHEDENINEENEENDDDDDDDDDDGGEDEDEEDDDDDADGDGGEDDDDDEDGDDDSDGDDDGDGDGDDDLVKSSNKSGFYIFRCPECPNSRTLGLLQHRFISDVSSFKCGGCTNFKPFAIAETVAVAGFEGLLPISHRWGSE